MASMAPAVNKKAAVETNDERGFRLILAGNKSFSVGMRVKIKAAIMADDNILRGVGNYLQSIGSMDKDC